MQVDQVIKAYIRLRDEVTKLTENYKKEKAKLEEKMDVLAQALAQHLEDTGLDSVKVSGVGVAFEVQKDSVTVEDPIAFMEFIKQSNEWGLLKAAATKSAVKKFLDEHDTLPPGVRYTRWKEVQVRRS